MVGHMEGPTFIVLLVFVIIIVHLLRDVESAYIPMTGHGFGTSPSNVDAVVVRLGSI
jgi:hypothetical protein